MKAIILSTSIIFCASAWAGDVGANRACKEIFNSPAAAEQCIGSGASFETINGCAQVKIITTAAEMLGCIRTKASFETINACQQVGFKAANYLNTCVETKASFVTINGCYKNTVSRKADDINECIRQATR